MGAQQSTRSRHLKNKQLPALPPRLPTLDFPPPRRCKICLDPEVTFPDKLPTLGCTHLVEVCVSCLETYVYIGIKDGVSLKCPSAECSSQMDVNEIRASIGDGHKEEFEKFCERKVRYQLQKEAALVWCRASGCGSGQIHVGGAAWPIVTCQKCSARTCFVHDTVWHEGKTCAQYTLELKGAPAERTLESKKSEIWISNNAKNCPGKDCGRPIQKQNGCDHMTCRKPAGCGHEFCWLCLAPYGPIRNQGNKLHKTSCKYYA